MKKLLDDLQKMRDFCHARHMAGVECDAVIERVRAMAEGAADAAQSAFYLGADYGVSRFKRVGAVTADDVKEEAARMYPRYTLHETLARDGTVIRRDWLSDLRKCPACDHEYTGRVSCPKCYPVREVARESHPTTGTTTKTDGRKAMQGGTAEPDLVKQLLATNWDLAQAVLALSKRLGPGYSPQTPTSEAR